MELSSLDVHNLALELRPWEDAYIDKAYQTGPEEYVFKLRHPQRGVGHLILRLGEFAAMAAESPPTPATPSTMATLLRKHLSGARLRRVDQHEFDRVLRFRLDRRGEPYELVVELFGKGNLILVDPHGKIQLVHHAETFSHRTIGRGEPFKFPPARVNPQTLGRIDFDALAAASERDLVRFLALDIALGGDLAEEVIHRTGLSKNVKVRTLREGDLERVWTTLQGFLKTDARPAIARGPTRTRPVSLAFESPSLGAGALVPTASLSEAILTVAREETQPTPTPSDLERERLERQLEHQEASLKEFHAEAEKWERRGHLVFEQYAEAKRLLDEVGHAVEASGWSGLAGRLRSETDGPLLRVDPERQRAWVRLGTDEVPLDPLESLEVNASRCYDEAKRVREKLRGLRTSLDASRLRLKQAASAPTVKTTATGAKAPAKRFWFETHRWFYSSEGFLVVAGRDATANEKLVKRHLAPGDRFLHADFHGAPCTIIKGEGRVPGPVTLREAAQFAVTYSRVFAQFASADAYWVLPEQVSKQAESGEYLAKGSFMVRGTRHYESKLKLEAALGLVQLGKQGRPGAEDAPHRRLMGGPPAALRVHARRLVVVERGDTKTADAAKQLAPLFGVTLDEVQAVLPPGTIRWTEPTEVKL